MNHAEHIRVARAALEQGTLGAKAEAAAHAAVATYELLAEFLAQVEVADAIAPPWQRNDLVRYREEGKVEFVALLQWPETEHEDPWWSAQVVRHVFGDAPMVGSSVRLREGSPLTAVVRFPD